MLQSGLLRNLGVEFFVLATYSAQKGVWRLQLRCGARFDAHPHSCYILPLLPIVEVCVELGTGIIDLFLESPMATEWGNSRWLVDCLELLHGVAGGSIVEFHW